MKTLIGLTHTDDLNLRGIEMRLVEKPSPSLRESAELETVRKIRAAYAETEKIARAARR